MMPAAVRAFDGLAQRFDDRFGAWASVAAQRSAVRRRLLALFPAGASLVELGGGTGEDALFLAAAGRRVLLTDGSPAMCAAARAKCHGTVGERVEVREATLEGFDTFATGLAATGARFEGAYSNFASLNCVADPTPAARGLARLIVPGGRIALVIFGPWAPGEFLVECARGRVRQAVRRLTRGPVRASVGGHVFDVYYPTPYRFMRAFAPWFRRVATRGIGVCVPPSAAEPWISDHPRLLRVLAAADRVVSRPLALLGDHVLVEGVRTDAAA